MESSLTWRSLKPTAYRLERFRGESPRRTKTYCLSEVGGNLVRSGLRVNPSRSENRPCSAIARPELFRLRKPCAAAVPMTGSKRSVPEQFRVSLFARFGASSRPRPTPDAATPGNRARRDAISSDAATAAQSGASSASGFIVAPYESARLAQVSLKSRAHSVSLRGLATSRPSCHGDFRGLHDSWDYRRVGKPEQSGFWRVWSSTTNRHAIHRRWRPRAGSGAISRAGDR